MVRSVDPHSIDPVPANIFLVQLVWVWKLAAKLAVLRRVLRPHAGVAQPLGDSLQGCAELSPSSGENFTGLLHYNAPVTFPSNPI